MRTSALVTAVLMLAVGGGCAESIATSPECERWIADYHQKLAESQPVQEISHAKRSVKAYVHRTIGTPTTKPHLVRTASPHDPLKPRISPQQMVKRFQVLCGDLPPVETATMIPPVLPAVPAATPLAIPGTAGSPSTPILTPGIPSGPGSPVIPSGPGGGGGTPTSPGGPTTPPTSPPTGPPTSPPTGPPTSPPTGPPTSPPTGPPTSPPTGPPSLPPTQPPTGPPAPPVPEPSSLVLMFAGSVLTAGFALRRRMTR